jgi:hypothetical protein
VTEAAAGLCGPDVIGEGVVARDVGQVPPVRTDELRLEGKGQCVGVDIVAKKYRGLCPRTGRSCC